MRSGASNNDAVVMSNVTIYSHNTGSLLMIHTLVLNGMTCEVILFGNMQSAKWSCLFAVRGHPTCLTNLRDIEWIASYTLNAYVVEITEETDNQY